MSWDKKETNSYVRCRVRVSRIKGSHLKRSLWWATAPRITILWTLKKWWVLKVTPVLCREWSNKWNSQSFKMKLTLLYPSGGWYPQPPILCCHRKPLWKSLLNLKLTDITWKGISSRGRTQKKLKSSSITWLSWRRLRHRKKLKQ